MPEARLEKTRQEYCKHEWHKGIRLDDIIIFKCFKCNKTIVPGIDDTSELIIYQPKSEQ